jgi:3-phenylpropionate/trans-cinnamate dioxygenase ferredoxin reductase subunit
MHRIVIVGASLAGTRALQALRAGGFTGELVLVGDEDELPYDRPPLSKQFLTREWSREDIALLSPAEIDGLHTDVRLGTSARSLDAEARRLTLSDGSDLAYDGLVIATGARPRTLPTDSATGGRIHYIRTAQDSRDLAAALGPGSRLGILGGGFLGAEVASSAIGLGAQVTVLERDPLPMSSVLGSTIGTELAHLMRAQGVELRTNSSVTGVGQDEAQASAFLADGARLDFDHLLVAIGAVPNCEWLEGSGLEVDGGVVTDEALFVRDGVVAAGDVVRVRTEDGSLVRRIEHWTNAAAQGEIAAANLLAGRGSAVPFRALPYVWSDQHGVRVEILGSPAGADRVEELWANAARTQRLYVCFDGAEPVALVGFNAVRWLLGIRRNLRESTSITTEVLDDLKSAVRTAS